MRGLKNRVDQMKLEKRKMMRRNKKKRINVGELAVQ